MNCGSHRRYENENGEGNSFAVFLLALKLRQRFSRA
jgi:hypothetical protein